MLWAHCVTCTGVGLGFPNKSHIGIFEFNFAPKNVGFFKVPSLVRPPVSRKVQIGIILTFEEVEILIHQCMQDDTTVQSAGYCAIVPHGASAKQRSQLTISFRCFFLWGEDNAKGFSKSPPP